MHVLLCQRASGQYEVQFVLVISGLFHVDVGPDLRHALGQEVALRHRELAAENGLGLGQVGPQKLIWNIQEN